MLHYKPYTYAGWTSPMVNAEHGTKGRNPDPWLRNMRNPLNWNKHMKKSHMVNLEHCRNPDQAALISPLLSAQCSLGWEDFTATATAIMYMHPIWRCTLRRLLLLSCSESPDAHIKPTHTYIYIYYIAPLYIYIELFYIYTTYKDMLSWELTWTMKSQRHKSP